MGSTTNSKDDDSYSSSIRPKKRLRLHRCPQGGGWVRTTNDLPPALLPDLPTELWSIIMKTLPYSSMIELSSTSRVMLKNVAPTVGKIQVDDWTELSPLVASRFTGVSSVDVACLLQTETKDPGPNVDRCFLCEKTASRIVPFLQKIVCLKKVWVGSIDGEEYHHLFCNEPECHEDIFDLLLDDFARAFEGGLLPSDLEVLGLTGSSWAHNNFRCIVDDDDETYQPGCYCCRNICHHFPLQHVVKMGYKDQYFDEHISEMNWIEGTKIDPPEGSMCFTHEERIAAIAERPGGREILLKEAMPIALKRWLDVAEQMVRVNEFGHPSQTGKFWDTALDLETFNALVEIEAVLPHVDVSAYDYETLIETIVFQAKDQALPKRGTLLIMKPTFDKLVSLGFPLHVDDFRCVVRREKGVTLGLDYDDDAWEDFDLLGLQYEDKYGERVIYLGPGFDSL